MKKLLFSVTKNDCRWDYYVGSGKGGQKRNKTSNCVRCTHEPSGAVGKAEEGRSQFQNRKRALRRMAETDKFKTWVRIQSGKIRGREVEIEEEVERLMHKKNLKVETKDDTGRWVENNEI